MEIKVPFSSINYCLVIAEHFILAKLSIRAPWCRCMIFTCISLDQLGRALEMNNPNSHCLKTAKLVYFLWFKVILDYQSELLIIDIRADRQKLHLNACFQDRRVRKRPRVLPVAFYWTKQVIGTNLVLLGWGIINISQSGTQSICE